MPIPVLIPLLNPNEPEAMLAALHVVEGQQVAAGDLLATLETTKAAADVTAEQDGFVVGLRAAAGESLRAGDTLCYLADTPDWTPPAAAPAPLTAATTPAQGADALSKDDGDASLPPGLRISRPALALARRHGLDLSALPVGPLITESMVRARLGQSPAPALARPSAAFDPTAIFVYGGGGHGKSLIDLLRTLGVYRLVGVVDDGLSVGETVMGLPVLGGREALTRLYAEGVRLAVNAVGGIGNIAVRVQIFRLIGEAGFVCPPLVHPTAWVEPSAQLSPGLQVFPHAYVGSQARLGYGVIVNTGAIVSHDCTLGDYVNISPGAMLAGGVTVGEGALVGMGVSVNLAVSIGARARVGNGATVKADVPAGGVVRAGAVWPAAS